MGISLAGVCVQMIFHLWKSRQVNKLSQAGRGLEVRKMRKVSNGCRKRAAIKLGETRVGERSQRMTGHVPEEHKEKLLVFNVAEAWTV